MSLNINTAMAGIPMGESFEQLDESHQQVCIVRLLERLVDQTETAGNEPDEYVHEHLGGAIMCMKSGMWGSVVAKAMIACKAPGERLPVLGGAIPVPTDRTLRQLMSEL